MGFDRNVFINCPFDDEYLRLLRPLLFTVIYLGFNPRIALETLDSAEPRIQKIFGLIRQSRYGIHDLSRIQAEEVGEYYRFNMPFELGLDIGCIRFKGGKWSRKKCLILEAERYRYKAALSRLLAWASSSLRSSSGQSSGSEPSSSLTQSGDFWP